MMMKLKIPFYIVVILTLTAFEVSAESASVTIASACQQGVLPASQCPQPRRACVHDREASVDTYLERQLGGRTLGEAVFGNEEGRRRTADGRIQEVDRCDDIGRVRAADVNRYFNNCDFVDTGRQYRDMADINNVAQLQLRDSLINGLFQDLASRSVTQINCRISVFGNYIQDRNGARALLHSRAQARFNQVRERIQGLILTKKIAIQRAQEAEAASNINCSGFAAVNGDMCLGAMIMAGSAENDRYEAAIAAEITKIPFGYEPDVANALLAMAENGQFNENAFFNAMERTQQKYNTLLAEYLDHDTPQPNGGTLYCISSDYKKLAVSSGIVDRLLSSYPPETMSAQTREILQCKLNSKYRAAPENIDTALNGMFLVGGGIAAVLTAVPTGGGSLATYGAVAGLGLSAVSFAAQLQKAHEACRQRSFLISPTGGEVCQAEQDFDHEVNQASLGRCLAQTGLAALEAVPIAPEILTLMRGRTGVVRTSDLLAEYNTPPIVVTAQRRDRRTGSGGVRAADSGGAAITGGSPGPSSRGRGSARRRASRDTETAGGSARAAGADTPRTAAGADTARTPDASLESAGAAAARSRTLPPLTEQQISSTRWRFIERGESAKQTIQRSRFTMHSGLFDLVERAPEAVRPILHSARRTLNSQMSWGEYIPELIRDVGEDMLRSNIRSIRDRALRGEITRNDVLRVLVKRSRARGETLRVVTGGDTDEFLEIVRSGPFFDRFFRTSNDLPTQHGVDIHLLQRDFVASKMPPEDAARLNEMFEYLGTREGSRLWDEMFDSTIPYSLTSPESTMTMVRPILPMR